MPTCCVLYNLSASTFVCISSYITQTEVIWWIMFRRSNFVLVISSFSCVVIFLWWIVKKCPVELNKIWIIRNKSAIQFCWVCEKYLFGCQQMMTPWISANSSRNHLHRIWWFIENMGLLQFNEIGAHYEKIFAGIQTNKFRNIYEGRAFA